MVSTNHESHPGSPTTNESLRRTSGFTQTRQTIVTSILTFLHCLQPVHTRKQPNLRTRLCAALFSVLALLIMAVGSYNIIAPTPNGSNSDDTNIALLVLGNLVLWVVFGMACLHAPSWRIPSISWHLYMLARPHIVEEDGGEWNEVLFDLEVEEIA